MENLYNKASLVLTPQMVEAGKVYSMKPEDRKGDFTFSRSTAATRVNASGNIEKETGNLLTESNNFSDSDWAKVRASVTSGQAGYDGTNDAWAITGTNAADGSASHYLVQTTSPTGVVTLSAYLKANGKDWSRILFLNGSNPRADFNLANGSVHGIAGGAIDANIVDVGSGWYRCSVTANINASSSIYIYASNANNDTNWVGDDTSGILIQDAQLEQGLVARDVITTTTTAIYGGITDNVPRLDYTDSSCPALLLEPQRTNIVPISEGVPEGTNNVTLTENYATSPEGVQNSLKVQKNGVDSNDRIQPIGNYNATLISGNDYTISCFVKNIDSTNAVTTLACRVSGGSLFRSGYDWEGSSLSYLATGYNAGTRKNIFVEDYGNGWWRIGFTFEANGTSGNFELDIDRRNGSNTTSIETWGWQLEQGSYATSYIPTYGSAVTRNADTAIINSATDLIGQTEGTLFLDVEFDGDEVVTYPSFINVDTNVSNRFGILRNPNDKVHIYMITEGVSQFTTDTTQTSGRVKIALAYANNDVAVYVNGTSLFTSSSVSIPATSQISLNRLGFSATPNTKSRIGNTMLFKTRLSNEELAALTTI
jgi:hypothetical protein